MHRTAVQRAWLSALVVCLLTLVACATQDGPFFSSGDPEMPLYQARKHCKEKVRTETEDGSLEIDWPRYDRCMRELGWLKAAPSQPTGPAPGRDTGRPY